MNAFFRWEFNSCETIVKDGIAYPIDYANASPDVALTSLHYYFPWAIKALVRWSAFCTVTRREMLVNQNSRDYFVWGDRDDLSYEEKLAKYRELADAYFQVHALPRSSARRISAISTRSRTSGSRRRSSTTCSSTPSARPSRAHEQEHFVAHYRGLLAAWARRTTDARIDRRGHCGPARSEGGPAMATTEIAARKLGKLAPRVDVRTLALSRYVDGRSSPTRRRRSISREHVAEWPMYANDRIGDCTTAAAAHMIEAWTAAAHGSAVEVTESSVLAAFDRVKSSTR